MAAVSRVATATLAAGCFWGVELAFSRIPGVISTKVGYTGGAKKSPSYREVCTGRTGHAEAVEVKFDPEKVSYAQLLDAFWDNHDPTTLNRQGPDTGTQYRSAIYYHDDTQKETAEASKAKAQSRFSRPIVTEITAASEFFDAEDYHQKYLEKRGGTCH